MSEETTSQYSFNTRTADPVSLQVISILAQAMEILNRDCNDFKEKQAVVEWFQARYKYFNELP